MSMVVAKYVAGKAGQLAIAKLRESWESRDSTLALKQNWEHDRKIHQQMVLHELEQVMDELLPKVENLEEKVEALLNDVEANRIFENFAYESIRSSMNDRREMLVCANAAIVDPRLTIQEKARIERKLRDLDPIDVRALYGLSKAVVKDSQALYDLWVANDADETLVSTGCVSIRVGGGGFGAGPHNELHITRTGRHVLHVLKIYLRRHGATFEIPGRTPELSKEQEEANWDEIRKIPGLLDIFNIAMKMEKQYFNYEVPPSSPTGILAKLSLYGFSVDQRKLIDAHVKSMRDSSSVISIEVTEAPDKSLFNVYFLAPHSLLRVAADHVEAKWSRALA